MLHTSQHGHSKTIYDDTMDITKLIVDIDTDGNICCVTKGLKKQIYNCKFYVTLSTLGGKKIIYQI